MEYGDSDLEKIRLPDIDDIDLFQVDQHLIADILRHPKLPYSNIIIEMNKLQETRHFYRF